MFSAKGTACHFLRCAKSNQKARARTHKKLPVASFCASETAETGRIANGREQGDHVSRSRLRPATSIQIAGRHVIFSEITGIHQVTGNAENSSFPGIAGNDLNRCERVAVVLTQDRCFYKNEILYCKLTVGFRG